MNTLIRFENAALLAVGLVGYHLQGGGWLMFAILFLVPDLSMLGYLAGPKAGAIAYNIGHSWIGPVLVLAVSLPASAGLATSIGLIWACHIAFDRMLGYGLKRFSGFHDTHLGRIGRDEASAVKKNR